MEDCRTYVSATVSGEVTVGLVEAEVLAELEDAVLSALVWLENARLSGRGRVLVLYVGSRPARSPLYPLTELLLFILVSSVLLDEVLYEIDD